MSYSEIINNAEQTMHQFFSMIKAELAEEKWGGKAIDQLSDDEVLEAIKTVAHYSRLYYLYEFFRHYGLVEGVTPLLRNGGDYLDYIHAKTDDRNYYDCNVFVFGYMPDYQQSKRWAYANIRLYRHLVDEALSRQLEIPRHTFKLDSAIAKTFIVMCRGIIRNARFSIEERRRREEEKRVRGRRRRIVFDEPIINYHVHLDNFSTGHDFSNDYHVAMDVANSDSHVFASSYLSIEDAYRIAQAVSESDRQSLSSLIRDVLAEVNNNE